MAGTVTAAVYAAEEVNKIPAPPFVLGLIAFGILCALLAITWTFNIRR
jgi:tellurite resistance protein TehA-like permease